MCGDGLVQSPNDAGVYEQCDDGNNTNNDACKNNCTLPVPSVCQSLSVATTTQNAPATLTYACQGT